jgi:hypothetical protein
MWRRKSVPAWLGEKLSRRCRTWTYSRTLVAGIAGGAGGKGRNAARSPRLPGLDHVVEELGGGIDAGD